MMILQLLNSMNIPNRHALNLNSNNISDQEKPNMNFTFFYKSQIWLISLKTKAIHVFLFLCMVFLFSSYQKNQYMTIWFPWSFLLHRSIHRSLWNPKNKKPSGNKKEFSLFILSRNIWLRMENKFHHIWNQVQDAYLIQWLNKSKLNN